MDRKILARRQLRYVTILQDYLEKKLTNNGPLIPSATKHSIYAMHLQSRSRGAGRVEVR